MGRAPKGGRDMQRRHPQLRHSGTERAVLLSGPRPELLGTAQGWRGVSRAAPSGIWQVLTLRHSIPFYLQLLFLGSLDPASQTIGS